MVDSTMVQAVKECAAAVCREMTRLDGAAARWRVEKLILACQDFPLPMLETSLLRCSLYLATAAAPLAIPVDSCFKFVSLQVYLHYHTVSSFSSPAASPYNAWAIELHPITARLLARCSDGILSMRVS
jgi:hypothetical protein